MFHEPASEEFFDAKLGFLIGFPKVGLGGEEEDFDRGVKVVFIEYRLEFSVGSEGGIAVPEAEVEADFQEGSDGAIAGDFESGATHAGRRFCGRDPGLRLSLVLSSEPIFWIIPVRRTAASELSSRAIAAWAKGQRRSQSGCCFPANMVA